MSSLSLALRLKLEKGKDFNFLSSVDKQALEFEKLFSEEFANIEEIEEKLKSYRNYFIPQSKMVEMKAGIPFTVSDWPVCSRIFYSHEERPEVARIHAVMESNDSSSH